MSCEGDIVYRLWVFNVNLFGSYSLSEAVPRLPTFIGCTFRTYYGNKAKGVNDDVIPMQFVYCSNVLRGQVRGVVSGGGVYSVWHSVVGSGRKWLPHSHTLRCSAQLSAHTAFRAPHYYPSYIPLPTETYD